MEKPSKPQHVIDMEYEKRFFESHGEDCCKICKERLGRLTHDRRCVPFIEGTNYKCDSSREPVGRFVSINMYCILEGGKMDHSETTIRKTVTAEDMRKIYEVYK